MSEWVIPFDDIELKELIGKGRMGEVYKYDLLFSFYILKILLFLSITLVIMNIWLTAASCFSHLVFCIDVCTFFFFNKPRAKIFCTYCTCMH